MNVHSISLLANKATASHSKGKQAHKITSLKGLKKADSAAEISEQIRNDDHKKFHKSYKSPKLQQFRPYLYGG